MSCLFRQCASPFDMSAGLTLSCVHSKFLHAEPPQMVRQNLSSEDYDCVRTSETVSESIQLPGSFRIKITRRMT